MKKLLLLLIIVLACSISQATSVLNHIMVIWGENANYATATAQPYLYTLATTYGLYTNYDAVGHPSEPNYVAFAGGSTFVSADLDTCVYIPNQNLVDLLESESISWREYEEDYSGPCEEGGTNGLYAIKHDFFISFLDINSSVNRTNNIIGFQSGVSSTYSELTGANPPAFVAVTPNLIDDGHNTTVAAFNGWLQSTSFFQDMLQSKYFTDGAIFITFDENGYVTPNQVYCVVVSALAKPGYQAGTAYTHYSLLRTMEDNWGLPTLTANDAATGDMFEALNVPVGIDLKDLNVYAPAKD
jgi:uncharacterized protein YceK